MLKNWLINIKIRNFIKSGFFVDYLTKIFIKVFLTNLVTFITLFLEKFNVDYFFKRLYFLLTNIYLNQLKFNYSVINSLIILLNVVLIILLSTL